VIPSDGVHGVTTSFNTLNPQLPCGTKEKVTVAGVKRVMRWQVLPFDVVGLTGENLETEMSPIEGQPPIVHVYYLDAKALHAVTWRSERWDQLSSERSAALRAIATLSPTLCAPFPAPRRAPSPAPCAAPAPLPAPLPVQPPVFGLVENSITARDRITWHTPPRTQNT
jgi:hypothetical protein